MPRVFVSVGSNVDPETNVKRAIHLLQPELGVRAISTFYRTPALKRPADPPFVNGVIEVGDALGPLEAKKRLRQIEQTLGRERTADRFAPRTVDLDLIIYGDEVMSSGELTLPHPDIMERPFVAIPLLELAADLVLPDSRKPLRSLVSSMAPYPMQPLGELTRQLRTEVAHGS